MDPTKIGLFSLAEQRLAWVDRRQHLLAQNVANANTPGFQPRDLSAFAAMVAAPGLTQTSPLHLRPAGRQSGETVQAPAERAPGGNAVSIEDQLGKVADTAGIQELVLNLEHTYIGMFKTALGRSG